MPAALLAALVGAALPTAFSSAAPNGSARIQIVDQRGMPVRDAVVEIKPAGGAGAFDLPGRAAMAQKNLEFTPGTLVAERGAAVAFPNLDRVRHSIYSFSRGNRFEIDLYGRDQTRSQTFTVSGTVALGCKIHDNMRGYIRVVDTPYVGKTDHNGFMALGAVPAGRAIVTVWHPNLRSSGNESHSSVTVSGALIKKYVITMK